MTEGMTLRQARVAAGVSREEITAVLGVSPQAVSRWELGAAWPSVDKLPALAAVLGMPMDDLIGVLIRTKGALQ